jgi:CRP-like cAMP-binding protein
MDGYGVLYVLSKNPKTESIPFIFLTAKAERSDMRKGMEMGADDYITKPFDEIELLNAVEGRLRKSLLLKKELPKNIEAKNTFIATARSIEDLKKLPVLEENVGKYFKKENIYKENSFAKGIYFIRKGKIKTFRSHELGKEFITGLYREGDFFGYLALMENTPYADTAVALEDTEVYYIPRDDFFELLYNNVEVSKSFIKLLSETLSNKEQQLVGLAYNSVRKKVADALVTLHNRYHSEKIGNFSISISREDLANIAGTATETIIRTLSDFKDEGFVVIQGGTIEIKDLKKLENLRN